MSHSRVAQSKVANFYISIIIFQIEKSDCVIKIKNIVIYLEEPRTFVEALENVIIKIIGFHK